jgi:hypothetical protein
MTAVTIVTQPADLESKVLQYIKRTSLTPESENTDAVTPLKNGVLSFNVLKDWIPAFEAVL